MVSNMKHTIKDIITEAVKRMIQHDLSYHRPETLGSIETLVRNEYSDEVIDMIGWSTIYKLFEEYRRD